MKQPRKRKLWNKKLQQEPALLIEEAGDPVQQEISSTLPR